MIKSLVDTTGTVNVMTIQYILLLHFLILTCLLFDVPNIKY